MMRQEEIPLSGGNVTTVVRLGDTVRRPMKPWSRAVQGLLRHLEQRGFEGAPRFLGVDDQGREILTFIPGEVGFRPYIWSETVLVQAARLLRRFHDATLGYVPPPDAAWQFVYPDVRQQEVICHNDFAPYNLVFVSEQPQALIDFDMAGPGPRIWDIAFAVYWFVPLWYDGNAHVRGLADLTQCSWRVRCFCDAYGCAATPALLDTVEQRLQALCSWLIRRAAAGDPVYQTMIDEGHLAGYQRALATFQEHRPALEQALIKPG